MKVIIDGKVYLPAPEPKQEKQQGFWRPEPRQTYFYWHFVRGCVASTTNYHTEADKVFLAIGNCFPTPEQAERYGELMRPASVFIACALAADPDAGELSTERPWSEFQSGNAFPAYVHTREQAEDLKRRLAVEGFK